MTVQRARRPPRLMVTRGGSSHQKANFPAWQQHAVAWGPCWTEFAEPQKPRKSDQRASSEIQQFPAPRSKLNPIKAPWFAGRR